MGQRKAHILIIDDDVEIRSLLRSWLESDGYDVAVAADGAEGLEAQRKKPADIAITDIFMPGKEGMETLQELRREFPETKIIVMSAGGRGRRVDYLEVARDLGAARSFTKPFEMSELSAAIFELLKPPRR